MENFSIRSRAGSLEVIQDEEEGWSSSSASSADSVLVDCVFMQNEY